MPEQAPAASPEVSIVIPAFNEDSNLRVLFEHLLPVLTELDTSWEIIFSDDGSKDRTWEVIQELHQENQYVRGIRLSRNFGHQYALFAGLQHAKGKAVISMDADLQHPPELIPELVAEWRKGNKIVKTLRLESEETTAFKTISSRLFYRLFSYLSGVKMENGMADFRLLDRQVLDEILKFGEEGLFLRGIVQWVGYPSTTVSFQCANRYSGTTKYTLRKMLRFAWHGVSSFSIVPLRFGVMLGFFASGISFLGVLYAIVAKIVDGHTVPGWASSVAIISLLFGMLFIFLGLLSEYIGRIFLEVRNRPHFLVHERVGLNDARQQATTSDSSSSIEQD